MNPISRREWFSRIGAGALAVPAWNLLAEFAFTPEAELLDLTRHVRSTARDRAFAMLAGWRKDGISPETALSAIFFAGIEDIRPRPVGFQLHAVMMVESAIQLLNRSKGDDRWIPAFYNLEDFKASQEADLARGDWVLAPPPEQTIDSPQQAKAELVQAMDAWNDTGADEAVTALCRGVSLQDLFESLWPYAIRDYRNIGHKPIFAAQVYRVLERLNGAHAESAVRSVVFGLLEGGEGETTQCFHENQHLLEQVRSGWSQGTASEEAMRALLSAFRSASATEAASMALKQLNEGIAPESIWTAIRLFASEALQARPNLLAVHPFTAANSLCFIARTARVESTRLHALLQAVSWMPLFRETLQSRMGDSAATKPIDQQSPPEDPEGTLQSSLHAVLYKATDHHEYKYLAAVMEDFPSTDQRWAAHLCLAATQYLPGAGRSDSEVLRRALKSMKAV